MNLGSKLLKLLKDPKGVIARRIRWLRMKSRYGLPGGTYRAEEYWRDRHGRYGFDLRGVGDYTMSGEENLRILAEGGELFLGLCREASVDLARASLLDIGCGTGYFAGVYREAGGSSYLGVDIVDTLFEGLRESFPGFRFEIFDAGTREIPGIYDLVIMMDVLQHITDEEKFVFAVRNAQSRLSSGGTLIIATSIGAAKRHSFYFVTRPAGTFERLFAGWRLSPMLEFSGNRMFSARRP